MPGSNGRILEDNEPPKTTEDYFVRGCLTWARLEASPFWPSIVICDKNPTEDSENKFQVQFFGRLQRAWISVKNLLKFEGVEAFHARAENAKLYQGVMKRKLHGAFNPTGNAKIHWEKSLKEMLDFEHLDVSERLTLANKLFEQQNTSTEDKITNSSILDSETVPKRLKLDQDAVTAIASIPEQVLKEKQSLIRNGFDLFMLAQAIKHNLDLQSTEDTAKKMSRLWNQMSASERMIYCKESSNLMPNRSDSSEIPAEDSRSKKSSSSSATSMVSSLASSSKTSTSHETPKHGSNLVKIRPILTSSGVKIIPFTNSSKKAKESTKISLTLNSASVKPATSTSGSPLLTKQNAISTRKIAASKTPLPKIVSHSGLTKINSNQDSKQQTNFCCSICEKMPDDSAGLIKCNGLCNNWFHVQCVKTELSESDGTWKCEDCNRGRRPCIICKSYEGEKLQCRFQFCAKLYHVDCLNTGLWPQAKFCGTQLTCPVHACHTCVANNSSDVTVKYGSRLMKCIRCPTVYHTNCIAAGSKQINETQIVCAKHLKPKKNSHVNVNWCFECSDGGTLVCCELCPAAFHPECLSVETPEGAFYCDVCKSGKRPVYGQIIWCKLGVFRWWPSKIMRSAEVPENIQQLPHDIGEFPVLFFGTNEYAWINQGRCFPFQAGDSEKIPGVSNSPSSQLDIAFKKGLVEAAEAFEVYSKKTVQQEMKKTATNDKSSKPPPFKLIKVNRPFGDCPVIADEEHQQSCDCDPSKKDPCGKDSDCINRTLMLECKPGLCKAGDKCGNMRIQKQIYPVLKVERTSEKGFGLFTKQNLAKGDFIIEYVGEVISMDEFKKRVEANSKTNAVKNCYFMGMDNRRMIDAAEQGNISRFMNHSCNPNCETQKWTVNGDTRIGLFARQDIPAGTELNFNYQFEELGESRTRCLCNAKNCSGFIGVKPNKEKGVKVAEKEKEKRTAVQAASRPKKTWDEFCFRCFEGGTLLQCDVKTCSKTYHLSCVNQDKTPREKWFCPWHHCVTCGKAASRSCVHCTNAYCKSHDKELNLHPLLGLTCKEHKDDLSDLVKFYSKIKTVSKEEESDEPVQVFKELNNKEDERSSSPDVIELDGSDDNWSTQSLILEDDGEPEEQDIVPSVKVERVAIVLHDELKVSESPKTIILCPSCYFKVPITEIGRHIIDCHPNLVVAEDDEILVAEETNEPEKSDQLLSLPTAVNNCQTEPKPPKRSNAFGNLSPASEACVPCSAAGCNKFVHHSNIARHWRSCHPELKRPQAAQEKHQSLSGGIKGSDSSFQISPEDTIIKVEIGEKVIDLNASNIVTSTVQSSQPSRPPMVNGQYVCMFEGCNYMTKFNSNMWRHQRKYEHFIERLNQTV